MAALSNLYYPRLRKQDFHLVMDPGGVSDALWQHREAVRHLLGPEEPLKRPSSWDLPASPRLESIFDFPDPVPARSPSRSPSLPEIVLDDDDAVSLSAADHEGGSIVASIEPADDAIAVHSGTDAVTLALVHDLAAAENGLRRPRHGAEIVTPAPLRLATASPPRHQKRKRCDRETREHEIEVGDGETTAVPPKKKKKKKKKKILTPTLTGDLVGSALPSAVQSEINFIKAMELRPTGWPSRNLLRKVPQTAGEISRKTGQLKTVRRGGNLRRWFGDEAVFGLEMWRWLVGEHEGVDVEEGE